MAAPNSTLPPQTEDEQNDRYNPAEQKYRELNPNYVSGGIEDVEKFANGSEDATKKLQEDEEYNGPNFYRASPGGKKQKITMKGLLKRKGPLAAILTVLLGGGGAFSILLTPGIGIVQLKEILVGDLNDQVAAVDTRTTAMWKTRLQSIQVGAGVCSNMVQIRCKFSSVSNKQVQRFKNAGFEIKSETGAFGRQVITEMITPEPDKVTIKNPQDLLNWGQKNGTNSASLNKVFNPLYAGLSDAVSRKVFGKFKTGKDARLTGTTTEELEKSMADKTTGDGLDSDGNVRPYKDAEGKEYLIDKDGTQVPAGSERYTQLVDEIKTVNANIAKGSTAGGKAVSGVLKGSIKGVSLIGVADSACSVYNGARAVAAAAKVARAVQLVQYAMVFLSTADSIKAGDATAEEVEFAGNTLTAIDSNKTVKDEGSKIVNGELQERENPNYGKDAFSSAGYSVAAYNDAPTLSTASQQYMVGGGFVGTLADVLESVKAAIPGNNPAASCGVIQSWWMRGIGLGAGVVAGIGSFGGFQIASILASAAISMSLPFIEAMLADVIAGNVTDASTRGTQSGDAIFAGTASLLGSMAMNRGLKPLKKNQLQSYLTKTDEVQNKYIAQARFEAAATPFDINNQYSFLGSFARSVNIPLTKASSSFSGLASSVPALLSTSLASIVPRTSAATTYNEERFSKCNDISYEELGIAADVFCNVRYGLSNDELNLDPLKSVDYMTSRAHVNEDGSPKSEQYTQFLKYCVDRAEGWGETGEENSGDWGSGKNCIEPSPGVSDEDLSNFRIFTLDNTIADAMDDIDTGAISAEDGSALGVDKIAVAKKIVAKNKVSYLGGTERPTIESIANGTVDPNALPCGINLTILNIIDKITDKHSITISDINRGCTGSVPSGSSTTSRHFAGNGSAIDISNIDGKATNGRDANALSVIEIAMPIMSEAAVRVDSFSQLGQKNCGASPESLPGIRPIGDFCNHLHMDVPPKADANLKYSPSVFQ
jgi:hypothetical protein